MGRLSALVRDERSDLLDLLRELDPAEWSAPSLCAGWTVRDVVAHVLSYEDLTWAGVVATFARGRLAPVRVNDVAQRPFADHTPAQLVDRLANRLEPRGFTTLLGGGIALADGLIHHQDIRRPLGRPRSIPATRLRPALDLAAQAPTLPSRRNRRGLRLVATDLEWSCGDGSEVSGPGEALLLAMAGRAVALEDLTGPGLPTLRERVSGTR